MEPSLAVVSLAHLLHIAYRSGGADIAKTSGKLRHVLCSVLDTGVLKVCETARAEADKEGLSTTDAWHDATNAFDPTTKEVRAETLREHAVQGRSSATRQGDRHAHPTLASSSDVSVG